MSAEVETMMYTREVPWHGLGTYVAEAPTSEDALKIAGLDWTVDPMPIYSCNKKIDGWVANTRSSDGKVLGLVSNQYRVVQNSEAFKFTDELIGGEVHYETAGSLMGGKKVWLLAQLPSKEILGDKVDTYVCFTNAHDGKGAVRAVVTPVRVVCNNTLNIALNSAKRSWSMWHSQKINERMEEARQTLELTDIYMEQLAITAERMANKEIKNESLDKILDKVIRSVQNIATSNERQEKNLQHMKENFYVAYARDDIAKFNGTAWGIINAASDMVNHMPALRVTKNSQANNWNKILVSGQPFFETITKELIA